MPAKSRKQQRYWAAGFFDGEGSCGFYTNRPRGYEQGRLQLTIVQYDRRPLERFQSVFGGHICGPSKRGEFRLTYTARRADAVMEELYPLLSEPKQEQVERAWADETEWLKERQPIYNIRGMVRAS